MTTPNSATATAAATVSFLLLLSAIQIPTCDALAFSGRSVISVRASPKTVTTTTALFAAPFNKCHRRWYAKRQPALFSATEEAAETAEATTSAPATATSPQESLLSQSTPSLFFINDDDAASSTSSTTKVTSGSSHEGQTEEHTAKGGDGLPWWWEYIWQLEMFQLGEPGTEISLGDSANVLRTNIEQIYGGFPSLDGCPLAEGALNDIGDGTMFVGLQNYFQEYGSPYKLCFGPKSFLVISDPVQARHILRDANKFYDKGVLAEILKPIMGKGLIPADPETWSVRRKQIVPAFHQPWLNHMVGLFGECNVPLIRLLQDAAAGRRGNPIETGSNNKVEMETLFCSVALDIIGLSIFNFDFGSVTKESPIIKAVYSALVEAEHRSMTPAPYWDLPLANQLVPRLRKFNADLKLLNDVLDDLITRAKATRSIEDIEELEKRNYDQVNDPSMLRFLVDMRGADIDNQQLRDDLMTMLIAGHETTAAVLTWALFELVRNPDCMKQAQAEIDRVLGDCNDDEVGRAPTYQEIKDLKYLRLVVAETLRMYPEPPLLIRRCRTQHDLPAGAGREATVIRGMDIFIAIYNIHRDERFWPEPNKFDPLRFTRRYSNPDIPDWAGFDPSKWEGAKLYPTETAADFAYLPFGGGARKCVGDEFATLEATVTLAMVLRQFDFEFDPDYQVDKDDVYSAPQGFNHPVGMKTGATIHTRNGLHMLVTKREKTTATIPN